MILRICLPIILLVSFFSLSLEAKMVDPYKVLGVERNANQRQIQKAFHKLSLQYHPDKNKNKGAQEKFAEINNAYEILSDEEKRKNYDLYGDEMGSPGFGSGSPGGRGGYTHFTSGNQGDSRFTYRPDEWQRTGNQGNSKSYSFSFGYPSTSGGSFNFGFDDIFSNFFGGSTKSWNPFGTSTGSQSGSKTSPHHIQAINSITFKKDITDKGVTWFLLSYTPMSKENRVLESMVEEVGRSLEGALKVGSINCQDEKSLCKELGLSPTNKARLFIYSYKAGDKGSLVEYTGAREAKSLKSFCQDHLPSFSRRVNLGNFDFSSSSTKDLPYVLLLSTKKNTPVIWRALSGLYRKRIIFYDAEVTGVSDPTLKRLGVDALPAVVGWLSNGEKHVLKTEITVKNLKSAVDELSVLLDNFEKKNKKATSSKATNAQENESEGKHVPLLGSSNLETICGERTPVCIIGVFRSSIGREKLESILSSVSQKSLTRQKKHSGVSVSYSLLDANKQTTFLNSFDKSSFKSTDKLLLAYKPRKGKFAAFTNEMTMEEVERFIGSVLNGDVQFSNIRQKPTLK